MRRGIWWGIWCDRSSTSMFGAAGAWMKGLDDKPRLFDTRGDALDYKHEMDSKHIRNCTYTVMEYDS